ncbi:MAG TPA: alpha/beta fold hydrolase [Acidobacteriota bacterium]|nr:alpha/beta fold hydrolase [Acidobacteriota bacterium]HQM63969.1 alpha/beta fold hydrolase [Acidobacteriota bacterium]
MSYFMARPMVIIGWILCLIGIAAAAPGAGAPDALAGEWAGTLQAGPQRLRLVFQLQAADAGGWTGAVISVDQGNARIPIGSVTCGDGQVVMDIPMAGARFTGALGADGRSIRGTWSQGGYSFPLELKRGAAAPVATAAPPPPAPPADPEELKPFAGEWGGVIDMVRLRIRIRLEMAEGGLTGRMFSVDQGNAEIPIGTVTVTGKQIVLDVPVVQGRYDGVLAPDGQRIEGTWRQGPLQAALNLTRDAVPAAPRRPQEPEPPLPYSAEDVTFRNEAAGLTLAGTLTRPPGEGPHPAVILITGSGTQDRDETVAGHRPFLVLADYLTRRGFAVLRCDDRGAGKSDAPTGDFTTRDLAGDTQAAFDFLKGQSGIDGRRIGLAGHSEGGIIAPMVAVDNPAVAFVVLMAGTGAPGARVLERQVELIARAEGKTEAEVRHVAQAEKEVLAAVLGDGDPAVRRQRAAELIRNSLSDVQKKQLPDPEQFIGRQLDALFSPWMQFFLTFDPRPTLARVKCPVLAVGGEKDLQVPAAEHLALIEAAVRDGGNTRVITRLLPGLNHLFQTCRTGAVSEYAAIEETLSPLFLQTMGDWLAETAGR